MQSAPPSIMIDIAQCESFSQQFKSDGSVVADYATGDHIGVYQISRSVWTKKARTMGWDIETTRGNIAMGLWIYKNYGTAPWKASETCWGKRLT